jgi:hypothetical protein
MMTNEQEIAFNYLLSLESDFNDYDEELRQSLIKIHLMGKTYNFNSLNDAENYFMR